MSIPRLLTAVAAGSLLVGVGSALAGDDKNPHGLSSSAANPLTVNPPTTDQAGAALDTSGELRASAEIGQRTDVSATLNPTADLTLAPVMTTVASSPVPDTPQNRARFGGPDSRGGRLTAPAGN